MSLIRLLPRFLVLMGAITAFGSSVQAQTSSSLPTKSVAVLAIVEHPSLDAVREGVRQALADAGFQEGHNLRWQYQSAQGNTGTAAQIARKFVGDKPDAIVAIATPAAQAVLAATREIPIVYAAITDPVEAQLVPSWDASGTNVTGVSDLLDLKVQIELIRQVMPHAKRVGMIYNPGEINSAIVVRRLKALLPEYGMRLIEAAAPRTIDVAAAARNLIGKVDVIYTATDNNVVSAYEALYKVSVDAKIPLIASDPESVSRGAAAALGIGYYDLGIQAGQQVVRILKGEQPGAIPSEMVSKQALYVSPRFAAAQGLSLPQSILDSAAKIVE